MHRLLPQTRPAWPAPLPGPNRNPWPSRFRISRFNFQIPNFKFRIPKQGATKSMVIDHAYLLEGQFAHELPEALM